jgi:hypothetical protein
VRRDFGRHSVLYAQMARRDAHDLMRGVRVTQVGVGLPLVCHWARQPYGIGPASKWVAARNGRHPYRHVQANDRLHRGT